MPIEPGHISKTYYDTLEVPFSSSSTDIHTAYLKAKNTYSSSNSKLLEICSKRELKELRKLIDQAFFVLGDPERRKKYDERISKKSIDTYKNNENRLSNKNIAIHSHYKKSAIFEKQIEECEVFDGPFLKNVRNYRNITLEELSLVTRIGKPYLIAIENNDYQSLPAPVFVRGFISQYARCLSLDPKKVVDSYMSLYNALYV